MNIALIGYGKMGKTIDRLATAKGHKIVGRMDASNKDQWAVLAQADVAIEFTNPDAAPDNISACLERGCPIVTGSTGWYATLPALCELAKKSNGALLYASNFSIGVNLFMEVNRQLAGLMDGQNQYSVELSETHHTEKRDAPSGTAITLAEGILEELERKTRWVNAPSHKDEELPVISHREPDVPGTHTVKYHSEIDEIKIEHRAHNRDGFALGAIAAAEWLMGKTGVFTMKDVLNLNQHS